jgi:hypothetical protein
VPTLKGFNNQTNLVKNPFQGESPDHDTALPEPAETLKSTFGEGTH